MPDRLFIRLDADGRFTWLRQAGEARASASSQSGTPPAGVLGQAAEVIVLVPAEDVLLIEAKVGARNRAQLLQAIPFAVEESLLGAVEDQHFAASPSSGDAVGVAIVAKARLREWMEWLAAAGVRADVIVPESLGLPMSADAASALVDGPRVLARFAPWSAFACADLDFPTWLAQARAAGMQRTLDLHAVVGATLPALDDARIATHASEPDALAFLARHLGTPSLNLLSGEFTSGHRQAGGTRWWRRAAALAAALIVLACIQRGADVAQLSKGVERVEADMAASLERTFPDLSAVERDRAPETVMRTRLERLRGGSEAAGVLRMLGRIAPILGTTTRVQMRGLEYRADSLEISLRAPDVQTLDSIREQIAAVPGLSSELTATNPVENATDGRIRIRAVAP